MSNARYTRMCPPWVTGLWLSLAFAALLLAGACRRGVPVVDTGPKPAIARGTITGIVRGPEGTSPMAGRSVDIINVATGEHHAVQTRSTGGFTLELAPGKYRLDLTLRDGETIVQHPGVVTLDRGDIDSHIEFVVATAHGVRPSGPGYRIDNGLGSPTA